LAELYLLRWARQSNAKYRLIGSRSIASLPQNEFEAGRFILGKEFLKDIEHLSPELRTKLKDEGSLPLSDLPTQARQKIVAMADLVNKELANQARRPLRLDDASLIDAQWTFVATAKPEYMSYQIGLSTSQGYRAWLVTDSDDRQQSIRDSVASGAMGLYDAMDFRQSAPLNADAADLLQPLSVAIESARIPDVLHSIGKQQFSGYITDDPRSTPETKDVSLTNVPIREAIRILQESFPGSEWQLLRSGVLLVRGPRNTTRSGVPVTKTVKMPSAKP